MIFYLLLYLYKGIQKELPPIGAVLVLPYSILATLGRVAEIAAEYARHYSMVAGVELVPNHKKELERVQLILR
jgi:hypothetical protein